MRNHDQQLLSARSNLALENYIEMSASASYFPLCLPPENYVDSQLDPQMTYLVLILKIA